MGRTSTSSHGKGIGVLAIVLGGFFLVVGIGAFLVFASSPQLKGVAWVWLIMAVLAVAALGFGVFLVRRGRREDKVLKSGLEGQATIVALTETGMGIGSGIPTDHSYTPICQVQLRVLVPGHPPYDATVREIVPLVRRLQLQPGMSVAVRVDPKQLSKVVIDWGKGATTTAAPPMPGMAMPGMAMPVMAAPGVGMAGGGMPVLVMLGGAMPAQTGPALPTLTVTGAESPDALRAAVRESGLAGTATIDAVVPAGAAPDGRKAFVLGMWINLGAGTPLRVDNAPTAVEDRFVHKVTVGATVPVRVALVGSAQATVLLWDEA